MGNDRGIDRHIAIEWSSCFDFLMTGKEQGISSTNAEACYPHARHFLHRPELTENDLQVLQGFLGFELSHEVRSFFCVFRYLPIVKIRRDSDETFARKTLSHIFNMRVEPPPLLDDDHRRSIFYSFRTSK